MKLLIFAALPLLSQIAPDQLRQSAADPTHLWAGSPTAGFVPVKLGAGFRLVKDATGFTLSVDTAPAPTSVSVSTVTLTPVNGVYNTTAQIILRNGLPQVEGQQYTRGPGGITLTVPAGPGDTIIGIRWSVP